MRQPERVRCPGRFVVAAIRSIGLALVAHAWMTVNVFVLFGALGAAICLFLPAWMLQSPRERLRRLIAFGHHLVTDYSALLLPVSIVALVVAAATLALHWRRIARMPSICRVLLLPIPLLWLPVLSAEAVRIVAMSTAIVHARPDCYGTSSFLASLSRVDGYSPSHAWMIGDGKGYLWSYRAMRFIEDDYPLRYPGTRDR